MRKEIAKRQFTCITPHFPTPIQQEYSVWEKILKCYLDIGYINETTTFITHSLGGIFVVKFCILNNIRINKLITIAGFNNVKFEKDLEIYNSFYELDEILSNFQMLCEKRYCIYSNDDPYVPKERAKEFAEAISGTQVEIKDKGHFSMPEFKELIEYIKQ